MCFPAGRPKPAGPSWPGLGFLFHCMPRLTAHILHGGSSTADAGALPEYSLLLAWLGESLGSSHWHSTMPPGLVSLQQRVIPACMLH